MGPTTVQRSAVAIMIIIMMAVVFVEFQISYNTHSQPGSHNHHPTTAS